MTVQAATQTQVLGDLHGTKDAVVGWQVVWATMANGDTGQPVEIPGYADKTIQVTGTFGTGGSVACEGSNDRVNFAALTNPTGTVIAITAANIQAVTEAVLQVRPHVTAGDGTTALVVTMFFRNTQQKF